jgi:hypothetical protein
MHPESDLVELVQRVIPYTVQLRCGELIEQRQNETLTPDEYRELLQLTHDVEQFDAQRVEHLVALARIRGVALGQVVDDLRISVPLAHG